MHIHVVYAPQCNAYAAGNCVIHCNAYAAGNCVIHCTAYAAGNCLLFSCLFLHHASKDATHYFCIAQSVMN